MIGVRWPLTLPGTFLWLPRAFPFRDPFLLLQLPSCVVAILMDSTLLLDDHGPRFLPFHSLLIVSPPASHPGILTQPAPIFSYVFNHRLPLQSVAAVPRCHFCWTPPSMSLAFTISRTRACLTVLVF